MYQTIILSADSFANAFVSGALTYIFKAIFFLGFLYIISKFFYKANKEEEVLVTSEIKSESKVTEVSNSKINPYFLTAYVGLLILIVIIPEISNLLEWSFFIIFFYSMILLGASYYISKNRLDLQFMYIQLISITWLLLNLISLTMGITFQSNKSDFWTILFTAKIYRGYLSNDFDYANSGFDSLKFAYDYPEFLYYGVLPILITFLYFKIFQNKNLFNFNNLNTDK